ncbi:MAG TPA: hypothetical protein VN934_10310 [Candidatus Tumulicola sp.]|nr:hypothetical protein [Candidatus Tumulicola sp.]
MLAVCLVLAVTFSQAVPAPSLAAPQFVATLTVAPPSYFGKCPALIKINGTIHNNAPFVPSVKYSILNSDGIDSFKMTATFNALHNAVITDARTPSIPGGYWVQMRIWVSNQMVAVSNKAAFTVECTGPRATPRPTPTPCILPSGAPCNMPTPCVSVPGKVCNPNATPTPKSTPCQPAAAYVNCKPDLTPRPPVTVGGHLTNWGGGVTLTDADAFLNNNGHCAFNIRYIYSNIGPVAALPAWKNALRVDANSAPVSIQTITLALAAGGTSVINTQAYLPAGVHTLTLKLNDTGSLIESNYANNTGTIKYQLTGKCLDTRPALMLSH